MRIGAIGDVIMTTPLLQGIKKESALNHITYLVGQWSADVLKHNPNIDQLWVIDEKMFINKDILSLWRGNPAQASIEIGDFIIFQKI